MLAFIFLHVKQSRGKLITIIIVLHMLGNQIVLIRLLVVGCAFVCFLFLALSIEFEVLHWGANVLGLATGRVRCELMRCVSISGSGLERVDLRRLHIFTAIPRTKASSSLSFKFDRTHFSYL
jgi:hypothetical protein